MPILVGEIDEAFSEIYFHNSNSFSILTISDVLVMRTK